MRDDTQAMSELEEAAVAFKEASAALEKEIEHEEQCRIALNDAIGRAQDAQKAYSKARVLLLKGADPSYTEPGRW